MAKLLVYSCTKPYSCRVVGEVKDGELIIVDDAVATKILAGSSAADFTDVTSDPIEDIEVDFPGVEDALAEFEAGEVTIVTRPGVQCVKVQPA
jgi:hypothetical protein